MGELDQVSAAIGELKGLMEGQKDKLDVVAFDVAQIKTQHIEIQSRSKSNTHRLDKVEASRMTPRDWAKLAGASTGITATIVGIVKGVEQFFEKQ